MQVTVDESTREVTIRVGFDELIRLWNKVQKHLPKDVSAILWGEIMRAFSRKSS